MLTSLPCRLLQRERSCGSGVTHWLVLEAVIYNKRVEECKFENTSNGNRQ